MLELLAHLDVSAASGIVSHDGALFVVADDGFSLLRVGVDGTAASRIALGTGGQTLAVEEKKTKPDFEALLVVAERVLALGSGSGAARKTGALVQPRSAELRTVALGSLYDELERHVSELNIEGAVVLDDAVLLAQRGNGAKRENALVRLDRAQFERELAGGALTPRSLVEIIPVTLGAIGGVPLSLTDLCAGPRGELLFTAAAEDTTNPWDDGVVAGSVIGVVARDGRVADEPLVVVEGVKLEGVCCLPEGELRLVADPDDPAARAPLFRLPWR